MRKITPFFLALIVLLALTACQKSPESPIVVGKNVDLLIDKATETQSDAEPTPLPENTDYRSILADKLGVPALYTANGSFSDGKLTFSANAPIELPNVAAMPVMRVEPANFSQEQVDRLYKELIGDTPMYQQQMRLTKTQIEDELIFWRGVLNGDAENSDSEEARLQAKEKIAELESAYASAADSPSQVPADATIGIQEEIDFSSGKKLCEYSGVDIAAYPGMNIQKGKTFSVHNNTEDGEIIIEENVGGYTVTDTASKGARFYFYNYDLVPQDVCYVRGETVRPGSLTDRPEQVSGFSYEDAMRMAEDFLSNAGIEDMQVDSLSLTYLLPNEYQDKLYKIDILPADREAKLAQVSDGKYDNDIIGTQIELKLVRTVEGIPVTSNGSSCYIGDAMFGQQWFYEEFKIGVCSEGVYSVSWASPHHIIQAVAEDANMKSFGDIAEIFDNMYRVKYDDMTKSFHCEGSVTRVSLTLRRIMEQNNIGYGLFVPAWDFYGTMAYHDSEEKADSFLEQSDKPILIINAIDGSVIDLDKGY